MFGSNGKYVDTSGTALIYNTDAVAFTNSGAPFNAYPLQAIPAARALHSGFLQSNREPTTA